MKRFALCLLLALVPFTVPAPYFVSWSMQPAEQVTVTGFKIYISTNTLTGYLAGQTIQWKLAGVAEGSDNTSFVVDVGGMAIKTIGVSQVTTNGEGEKLLLPVIPPPTNGVIKSLP